VHELHGRRVVRRLSDILPLPARVERQLGRVVVEHRLDDLDLRPVEPLDRPLEVSRLGDRQANVVPEGEPQVVGDGDIGRVGDGDEQEVVGEEADGHRLEAGGELARQQHGDFEVELGLGEVDVLEPVLHRERLREVLRRHPAVPDDDLAEPLARQLLLLEGLLDLVDREQALVDQQ
jgi:hypothetical protein